MEGGIAYLRPGSDKPPKTQHSRSSISLLNEDEDTHTQPTTWTRKCLIIITRNKINIHYRKQINILEKPT